MRRSVCLISASQHTRRFISHHDLIPLVFDVNPGHNNAAIAFRGRPHGAYLDLAMNGVAYTHRRKDLLLELEHGKPGALDHALAQEPLDQAIGQCRRHELAFDSPFFRREGTVNENGFKHAGDAREHHQIGLGNSAVEGAETLARRELFPGKSEAERLHAVPRAKTVLNLRRPYIPARDSKRVAPRT